MIALVPDHVLEHEDRVVVVPGIALIGTYGVGSMVNAAVTVYFYGDDSARAASSGEKWRTWIGTALSPVAR
jgi:hypothetical protein